MNGASRRHNNYGLAGVSALFQGQSSGTVVVVLGEEAVFSSRDPSPRKQRDSQAKTQQQQHLHLHLQGLLLLEHLTRC